MGHGSICHVHFALHLEAEHGLLHGFRHVSLRCCCAGRHHRAIRGKIMHAPARTWHSPSHPAPHPPMPVFEFPSFSEFNLCVCVLSRRVKMRTSKRCWLSCRLACSPRSVCFICAGEWGRCVRVLCSTCDVRVVRLASSVRGLLRASGHDGSR